jgi:hypothetical protein
VFFGLAFLACPILSTESCAWINSATASGILGGPVEATVTHSTKNRDDGTCEFRRGNGALTSTIHIEVITTERPGNLAKFLARCSSKPSPMQDFGNEAMACTGGHHGGRESEQIVGHVRDRTFVITVMTTGKSASSSSLREEARSAAGQVVGNLF